MVEAGQYVVNAETTKVVYGSGWPDALAGPVVVIEQAVGVTRVPFESKGLYPKQVAYSDAQTARLVSGLPRQVLYAAEQISEQLSDFPAGEARAKAARVASTKACCISNVTTEPVKDGRNIDQW